MLKRLTIQNYALIDSLDITFPGNLVIITGETGAGKSILLGALSLLLGVKADVSALKDKGHNCVVEAEFVNTNSEEMLLRRVVSSQGRSRVFLNDEPISMDDLKELSKQLIDIHAQHQQLLLSERQFQMGVLDSFAGITTDVEAYREDYNQSLSLEKELKALDEMIAQSDRQREYNEFQYKQLDDAKLIPDELDELESEQQQLAHSEEIKETMSHIGELFNSDEDSSIAFKIKQIELLIEKISSFIPSFASLSERVASVRIELKDVEQEIAVAGERVVYSPERLAIVDARLSLLYDLLRKHSVSSIAELIAVRDELSEQLGIGVDAQIRRNELCSKIDQIKHKCLSKANDLSAKRKEAAPRLASTLQNSVRSIEMPQAIFEVRLAPLTEWGRDGKDDVQFYFSANEGVAPKELSKCASGGELSRIMLCIKALMAKYMGMPTMIFDEIDTGVSGSIADKMGDLIGEMGENMQVFAITHLPQVASKGDAHYLVYKELNDKNETASKIKRIDGEQRVMEIARMLSGSSLTPEAIANAKVLMKKN